MVERQTSNFHFWKFYGSKRMRDFHTFYLKNRKHMMSSRRSDLLSSSTYQTKQTKFHVCCVIIIISYLFVSGSLFLSYLPISSVQISVDFSRAAFLHKPISLGMHLEFDRNKDRNERGQAKAKKNPRSTVIYIGEKKWSSITRHTIETIVVRRQ